MANTEATNHSTPSHIATAPNPTIPALFEQQTIGNNSMISETEPNSETPNDNRQEIMTTSATAQSSLIHGEEDNEPELRAVVVSEGNGYHLHRSPAPYSFCTSTTNDGLSSSETATAQRISVAPLAEEAKEEIIEDTEYQHPNNYGRNNQQHAYMASATASAVPSLAGVPTYSIGAQVVAEAAFVLEDDALNSGNSVARAAMATSSLRLDDEESEMAALKRAAAYGGNSHQKPQPMSAEGLEQFYARTCEYWNALAMDSHSQGGDIDIEQIMEESMRLAREQFMSLRPNPSSIRHSGNETQEATVVEITDGVHPSDLEGGTVQAEFVGEQQQEQSFGSAALSHDAIASSSQVAEVTDGCFEQTAEATVLDSAPADKIEGQIAWQNTEEAHVLQDGEDSDDHDSYFDRKPSAVENPSHLSQVDGGDFAVADQEAEVVSIMIHPHEYPDEDHAEAEIVGTDFNYISEETRGSSAGIAFAEATAATEESQTSIAAIEETTSYRPNASHAIASNEAPTPEPATRCVEVLCSPIPEPDGFDSNPRSSSEDARAIFVDDETNSVNTSNNAIPVTASIIGPESVDHAVEAQMNADESFLTMPPPIVPPQAGETSLPHERSHGELQEDCDEPPEWLQDFPPEQQGLRDIDRHASATSSNTSQRSQLQYVSERASQVSAHIARSSGNLMETLFGDTRSPSGRRVRANTNDVAHSIIARTLLPWSVIHSTGNNTWVATLQTNQKALDGNNIREASKSLRAFSLPSEVQAVCLAKSWTPPRMMPFEENSNCHVCQKKFAVFKRPCHCRNCGVCICKDCAVQWPSKMIPETYNIKKESLVNACVSCDWLCRTFRVALLEGEIDEAVALHATGNINLTCPFANIKGEEFYPVHCAVIGGNIKLLRWLVDGNCCPIKSVRVSGKTRDNMNRYTPIVTSRGRSLLGIAMEDESIDIVRYLVVEKGLSIAGEKDITLGLLIKNMEKVLRLMPDSAEGDGGQTNPPSRRNHSQHPTFFDADEFETPPPFEPTAPSQPQRRSLSEEARDFGAIDVRSEDAVEDELCGRK